MEVCQNLGRDGKAGQNRFTEANRDSTAGVERQPGSLGVAFMKWDKSHDEVSPSGLRLMMVMRL